VRVLVVILLIAAALRVGYSLTVGDADFLAIDGRDYRDISQNLASGNGYSISYYRWFEPVPQKAEQLHPDFLRPPLLPLLGAALHLLPLPWVGVAKTVSILLGCCLVLAVYMLGARVFDQRTGLVAAAIASVYPPAIYYAGYWSTETVFALFLVLGLALLPRPGDARPPRATALSIGALALAALARPTGLVFLVGMFFLALYRIPKPLRLRCALVTLAVAMVILGPWMGRNAIESGRPTPATFFGGYNAWLGMNARMDAMYDAGESPEFQAQMDSLYAIDSKSHVRSLEESETFAPHEQEAYWKSLAMDYVLQHPGPARSILLRRLVHFFRPWPNRASTSGAHFAAALLTVFPVFVLAAGTLLFSSRGRSSRIILQMALAVAVSLPFVFHHRFRFPMFEPFAIVLAAVGLMAIRDRVVRLLERTRTKGATKHNGHTSPFMG